MTGDRAVLSERSRRLIFTYLFGVYLLAAVSETLISPLFPLIRDDLGLSVAQQASLVAALTTTIGVFNLVGGALGYRSGDRRIVRAAALALAIGTAISGAAGSYLPLLLGQIVIGVGSGLFFGPGLASIGRMYTATRGRAVASYGLAYSLGLALASFSANAGQTMWRWMFWGTAALALLLAFVAPRLVEARETAAAPPLLGSLKTYLANPLYRMSLVTGAVAGTMSYVVLGFTPTLFDDRGAALAVITALVGIGRLVSAGGKYLSGWMFDRIGGPYAARVIMLAIVARSDSGSWCRRTASGSSSSSPSSARSRCCSRSRTPSRSSPSRSGAAGAWGSTAPRSSSPPRSCRASSPSSCATSRSMRS